MERIHLILKRQKIFPMEDCSDQSVISSDTGGATVAVPRSSLPSPSVSWRGLPLSHVRPSSGWNLPLGWQSRGDTLFFRLPHTALMCTSIRAELQLQKFALRSHVSVSTKSRSNTDVGTKLLSILELKKRRKNQWTLNFSCCSSRPTIDMRPESRLWSGICASLIARGQCRNVLHCMHC